MPKCVNCNFPLVHLLVHSYRFTVTTRIAFSASNNKKKWKQITLILHQKSKGDFFFVSILPLDLN